MRVLVTGATGFVGSHTARALLAAGHQVRVLARRPERLVASLGAELAARLEVAAGDMTDAQAVARALDGQTAVVHAAAVVKLERRHAARVLAENRAGVETVVGAAAARGLARILYVSSVAALFRPGAPSIHASSPVSEGESAYQRSKAECEAYVRALQAAGAPILTTYPGGIVGPDDPGLSEANRGLLALFRDLAVVTSGGMQLVDVRDVARAHVRLLEAAPAPGRYMLGGHFLRWAELVDLFEDVSGQALRRVRVPGPLLRAAGTLLDLVKHVRDVELPLTHEAACLMTRWVPASAAPGDAALGIEFRAARDTVRDTLVWLHAAQHLQAPPIRGAKESTDAC